MTAFPFAPLQGLFHCARGRGVLPRWAFFLLSGLIAWFETGSFICGLAAPAGFALWLAAGWGNGLIAITGRDTRDPHECAMLFRLAEWVVPYPSTSRELRRWGAVFMALRGLYLYPLFVVYAFLLTPWSLAIGLLCACQGPVYYVAGKLVPERVAVATSELVWGTILGLLIAACNT